MNSTTILNYIEIEVNKCIKECIDLLPNRLTNFEIKIHFSLKTNKKTNKNLLK
jgi:hypothetical protein